MILLKKHTLAAILALLSLAAPLGAQDDEEKGPAEEAAKLMDRITKRPDKMWDYTFTLRRMAEGENKATLLTVYEKGLDHESPHVRLACARLVVSVGTPTAALETLGELVKLEDSAIVEPAAMLLADLAEEDEEINAKLRAAWQSGGKLSIGARVALCEAMFACTGEKLALEQLREFLSSGDHELVARASLALADLNQTAEIQGRMGLLKREPGPLGRLARTSVEVLDIRATCDALRKGANDMVEPLLVAEMRQLMKHYVDPGFSYGNKTLDLNASNLVDNAGRAMARAVDDYSELLTAEEIREMEEDSAGRYAGIGAIVGKLPDDPYISITQPIYEGPAYKAGLRSGDRIVAALDKTGQRVDLANIEVDDAVQFIRDREGTTATIFVKRRGTANELKFEIKRAMIAMDTALAEMLPGNVGYIRLTKFGSNSHKDMERALRTLQRMGMKTLILDLRGNPGGQLEVVLKIADNFLKRESKISHTGGRWGIYRGTQPPFRSEGGAYTEIAMTVLIDEDSASGSEMLSGALKDNKRVTVIGQPTFGKGVGQTFFELRPERADRTLKLTVFSYFLPSGINIDRHNGVGGVTPDIRVDPEYLKPWEFYAREKLISGGKLDDYLDAQYTGEGKAALMKLADFDGKDITKWPKFEDLYASLKTKLGREDVRRELRYRLRIRVADDRGVEFVNNYQDDKQLLRAIKEVMAKAGQDPKSVSEYAAVMKD
ncbi:MAG: PDZ domain-containing protein [Planctomycetes bacterium]|nr:PDZ domain-containing protein [Planctomycetota bacterium]